MALDEMAESDDDETIEYEIEVVESPSATSSNTPASNQLLAAVELRASSATSPTPGPERSETSGLHPAKVSSSNDDSSSASADANVSETAAALIAEVRNEGPERSLDQLEPNDQKLSTAAPPPPLPDAQEKSQCNIIHPEPTPQDKQQETKRSADRSDPPKAESRDQQLEEQQARGETTTVDHQSDHKSTAVNDSIEGQNKLRKAEETNVDKGEHRSEETSSSAEENHQPADNKSLAAAANSEKDGNNLQIPSSETSNHEEEDNRKEQTIERQVGHDLTPQPITREPESAPVASNDGPSVLSNESPADSSPDHLPASNEVTSQNQQPPQLTTTPTTNNDIQEPTKEEPSLAAVATCQEVAIEYCLVREPCIVAELHAEIECVIRITADKVDEAKRVVVKQVEIVHDVRMAGGDDTLAPGAEIVLETDEQQQLKQQQQQLENERVLPVLQIATMAPIDEPASIECPPVVLTGDAGQMVDISIEPTAESGGDNDNEGEPAILDFWRTSRRASVASLDLEWEFDNEPPFETRNVQVKRNADPREEYELGEELGRGKFGTVYRCVEQLSGRKLAAKFVHTRRHEDREDVEREVAIMRQLQHKRLLQLYDAFDDGQNEMCLIMELIEGGELFERIIDDDFELTERKAAIFMRQICEGVEYMHQKNIVHMDMKPENILCLSKTGNRIKLIDFGLARQLDPAQPLRVMFGTPDFAAPEVLAYDLVSLATDMWSVGVICYVLLSGLSPFMGDNDMETMANVTRATYDFEDSAFDPISDLAKDFISKLLVREQSKRLTPSECLAHPWLERGGAQLEASVQTSSRRNSMAILASAGASEIDVASLMAAALGACTPPSPVSLDKRNLKKYVVRRKWHKTVHAIMALGRMGANLKLKLGAS